MGLASKKLREGFSLLEVLIATGIASTLALGVSMVLWQLQSSMNRATAISQISNLKAEVMALLSGSIGQQALRNFVGGPTAYRPGMALPALRRVELNPNRTCREVNAPSNSSVPSSEKTLVDAILAGAPIAITGQPLNSMLGNPMAQVKEMSLIQVMSNGNVCQKATSNPPACSTSAPCSFLLRLEFELFADAAPRPTRVVEMNVNCNLKAEASDGGVKTEFLVGCAVGGALSADAATTDLCEGDLNKDGEVDIFDRDALMALWGPIPAKPAGGGAASSGVIKLISTFSNGPSAGSLIQWSGPTTQCPQNARNSDGTCQIPIFGTTYRDSLQAIYGDADLDDTGYIDGGDLALMLLNWGCKKKSNYCYEQNPFAPVQARAAAFVGALNVVDGGDLGHLLGCMGPHTEVSQDRCNLMNLDGRCSYYSEWDDPNDQATDPVTSASCMDITNGTSHARSKNYWPVGQADLSLLNLVWSMQGLRPRYQGANCATSTDGTYGTASASNNDLSPQAPNPNMSQQ